MTTYRSSTSEAYYTGTSTQRTFMPKRVANPIKTPDPNENFNLYKEKIVDLNDRIKELQDIQKQNNIELKQIESKTIESTRLLAAKVREKTDQLKQIEEQLQKEEINNKKQKQNIKQQFAQNLEELKIQYETEVQNHVAKIQEINNEINEIDEFKKQKYQLQEQLAGFRDKYTKARNDLKKQKELNDQKRTVEVQRLKQMQDEKLQIIKHDAEKAVRSQMSRAEKTVHAENDRLITDLDAQRSEMTFLKNQSIEKLKENFQYQIQLSQIQKDIDEKAGIQFELKRTILQLQNKMEELNQNMTQVIEDFEKEKMLMTTEFERQCQEKEIQIYNYKNKITMREKELKTLKGLGQMVLDQRSDIEQFFLEGIYDVMGNVPSDINEMTNKQKEDVLRIIFSKMNTGIPAVDWKGEFSLPIIN